jgi:cysteine synthase A
MPNWMRGERIDLIHSLAAKIVPVTKQQGGFLASIRMSEEMAADRDDVFLPRQFSNSANVEAHARTTGPELYLQLKSVSLTAALSLPALAQAERSWESESISGGRMLRSASSLWSPPNRQRCQPDAKSANIASRASQTSSFLTSGAGIGRRNQLRRKLLAAVKVQDTLGTDAVVTTVFADDNKTYLSTDLLGDEPVMSYHLSPAIRLTSFRTTRRVCNVCGDTAECDEKVLLSE